MNDEFLGQQIKERFHRKVVTRDAMKAFDSGDPGKDYSVIRITLRDPDKSLLKFLEDLKARANPGHSFSVVSDPDDSEPGRFGFDGDGPFFIRDIELGEAK